ncbi:hypothetical protein [Taklimakanibacter lacteus]|uniref:hypothetical protein n=1 Tax=Taklimakanibacter lacteus TaxID=2268456 RepID=UPI0013C5112A
MNRLILGGLLLTAMLAGPALAKDKPKLAKETRDAAQITQENIVKMKLKRVTPNPNQNLVPSLPHPQPVNPGG